MVQELANELTRVVDAALDAPCRTGEAKAERIGGAMRRSVGLVVACLGSVVLTAVPVFGEESCRPEGTSGDYIGSLCHP
jgi:hypothetical protein